MHIQHLLYLTLILAPTVIYCGEDDDPRFSKIKTPGTVNQVIPLNAPNATTWIDINFEAEHIEIDYLGPANNLTVKKLNTPKNPFNLPGYKLFLPFTYDVTLAQPVTNPAYKIILEFEYKDSKEVSQAPNGIVQNLNLALLDASGSWAIMKTELEADEGKLGFSGAKVGELAVVVSTNTATAGGTTKSSDKKNAGFSLSHNGGHIIAAVAVLLGMLMV
ncbi:hypothetical protein BKA69DRAFT_1068793 [Paraphysoderma sedebokerense]|nr:hypothetical protein BKA69DRAFT_1068793 [Paraphysoderma sedebokerense]